MLLLSPLKSAVKPSTNKKERIVLMKRKLVTVDAETLLSTPMSKTMFIVDGLIPQGVNVLSGAAKIGKSWLMLWLGLQVSQGFSVWGIPTMHCDVLYLCLEDTLRRIKDRLFDLTDDSTWSYEPKEKPDSKFYEAMRQLSAIGNNINQLAVKANALDFIDMPMLKTEAMRWHKFQADMEAVFLRPNQSNLRWK